MSSNTRLKQDFGSWDQEGIYKDTGCELHSKCLTCPLPQCIFDFAEPAIVRNRCKAYKFISLGITSKELALLAGISVRTSRDMVTRYNQVGGDFNQFIG